MNGNPLGPGSLRSSRFRKSEGFGDGRHASLQGGSGDFLTHSLKRFAEGSHGDER